MRRVGIAVSTTGYQQPDEILRDASVALHRAKTDGTTACEIFDPAMRKRAVSCLQLETDLRKAVEAQSFEVHYQPIVSLKTGRITAVRGACALAPSRARDSCPRRIHQHRRRRPA